MKIELVTLKPRLFIKVRNTKTGVIRVDKEVECHSFVKNFYIQIIQQILGPAARSSDNITVRDITNSALNNNTCNAIGFPYYNTDYRAGASISAFGLVVGASATAWSFTDYILSSQLTEGIGAGKLHYGADSAVVISNLGAVRTATWNRSFYNNGVVIISVNEVGWYWQNCFNGGSYSRIVMVFRDVLSSTISVDPAEELQVTLAVQLTYPETIS